MDRICDECQRPDWSLRAGYSRKAVKGFGQDGESSLTIPTLVEPCSADQAFPLITNRRALSHPPWPFHSLPWVVSRHNLQRAVECLPRRQSALKAGSSCQVLSPSPFLPLRDMEDGHIPLLRHPTAWEKGCACSNVLIYTDNSWIAFLGWEHPLPACPLVCSPAPLGAAGPLPALTSEAQTTEWVREVAASASWTCPFSEPSETGTVLHSLGSEEVVCATSTSYLFLRIFVCRADTSFQRCLSLCFLICEMGELS